MGRVSIRSALFLGSRSAGERAPMAPLEGLKSTRKFLHTLTAPQHSSQLSSHASESRYEDQRNSPNWRRCSYTVRFLQDRKSTRLNSSHSQISYAVFCLKKKTQFQNTASLEMVRTEAL